MLSNTLQFTTLLVCSLLISIPTTFGQDLNGLPACAGNCLASSLASAGKSCTTSDFACLCKNHDFVTSSDSCYTKSCSADDYKTAQAWGAKTCAAAGVQLVANGVNSAANGINNAANSATTALTGGAPNNSTSSASTIGHSSPAGTSNTAASGSNTAPVNNTSPTSRPNSGVALSAEVVKSFAIGSALLTSLFMI